MNAEAGWENLRPTCRTANSPAQKFCGECGTPLASRLRFTAISERLDPGQILGDGRMALFGAPKAHEDHAHRALSVGLGDRGTASGGRRRGQ